MSNYKLTIVQLYPKLLNLYGDKGNIACLINRLKWRGIDAELIVCDGETSLDLDKADMVFLGGGADRETEIVQKFLDDYREELKNFVEDGGAFVAICSGYQMLGKYYPQGEKTVDGLGILDIYTEPATDGSRLIGNVVLECDGISSKVVGFENHSGRTKIGNYEPLGKVIKGYGNDGKSGFEGVIYKNLIGTNLHGPIFPKNPQLCDSILCVALKNKYPEFEGLSKLDDGLEILANEYMVNRI